MMFKYKKNSLCLADAQQHVFCNHLFQVNVTDIVQIVMVTGIKLKASIMSFYVSFDPV